MYNAKSMTQKGCVRYFKTDSFRLSELFFFIGNSTLLVSVGIFRGINYTGSVLKNMYMQFFKGCLSLISHY